MKKRLMLLLVLVLAALHVDAEETHIQQNDDDNNPQYGKETALDYEGSGYIGCFQDDSSSRTVDGPLITDNSMTIEQCRDKCYQLNKNIAGLENGNACYCGNTYKQTIRLKDSQCNRRCPGNKKQTCGGHGAISVYKAKSGKHNIDNKLKRNKRSVRRRRKRGKKIRRKNRKRRGKSGAKNRKSGRKGNIRKKTWKCYRYSAADKKQIKKKGQKAVCQRFGGKFTRGKNARYPGCRTCWCCQRKEKKRTCKNVKCKKNFVCVKGKCKRRTRGIKKIVCEYKSATLKCPGKKTIKILEATYGRTDRTTCKHHAIKTTSCSSTKPLPIIRKKCDGVNSCGVWSSNRLYGDPCRGTYKYLVVRYICEARGIKKIVCEYKSATLKCPGKKTIKILEATYGRTDRTTCKHHAIKTTSCSSTKPLPIIRKKCDGVNSCGVTSSNGLYGNPCRGTYKYLVVRYICEGRSISNIVCEGKSATLKCPGRKIIKILAATYGRTDMTTCKHHSIKTTSCSSDKPLPIIMKKCDGVNSCGVTSSNGLYGDPCRGTYKYLVVRYICKAKKRTCKNVKCKKNFVCVKGKCQRKGTTTCKRKCKKNAECKNGKCQCKKGFYKSRRGSCKSTSKCKKPCHSNAKCRKGRCICEKGYSGDGVNKCSKSCTCSATGDPHYRLFDGQMIHFMGTCKYLLSKYDKQKSTCRYEVQVRNENRGKNKRVSFTKSVHVIVRGTKIDLLKKKKLQINGVKTFLPYKSADFSITNTGRYIKLVTLCKVVITWDGRSAVTVIAPQHLSPSLSGLCGNCNGIRDDFRLSGGLDVRMKPDKFKLIGESYLIPEGNDKKCGIETPPDPCTPVLRKKAEGNSACGRISLDNPNNPFKKCASKDKAMVEDMYETCIYDYCAYSDVPDMLDTVVCEAAEGLEERCGNMGLDINWRTKSFCPIACGENMEYSSAISGCPATCVDEDAPKFCIMAISEGCQCKKGFVLSDDKCIPKEQCGCRGPAGEYYPISTEITSRDCTSITRCIVTKSGKAKLKLVQRQKCHRNGKCILQDGIFQCVCEDGYKGDGISKCKGPKGPDIENIICEGKSATLKCPGRKTIKILEATYGRTDMTTCKHPSIKTTSCSSYKPLPIIRKKCDGVNSCSVTSSNGLYGDPCRGTYKYLVVRYICEGNQPKCGSSVCHSDAKCQRRHCVCKKGFTGDGVNSCIGTCTCSATGDPHYKTFDGQVIHFMGICTYTMVKSTGVDKCGGFRVEVKNEHRGNKRVSFTRYVDVILKDTIIHLGRKNQILVNNVEVFTPYSCINFEITASGKYVRLQTKCGMVVTWNGRGAVSVSLPKTYSGKVSGLCGDCNGKRDDFRTATGEDVRSKKNKFVLIGNSYIVKEKSDMTKAKCIVSTIDDEPCSSKDKLEKASKDRNCGMMNPENTKSPFKSCFSKNMAMSKELYDTCLYDYCSNMDQPNLLPDIVCESMEGYEEQCENMGLSITWRGTYFCPMQCDANMEYSSSVSGCPATCVNPDAAASCRLPNSEGCQCKRGFLLSGTECVPKSKCGCRGPQGEYYPLGKTVTSADCSVITKCSIENGKATMIKVKSQNCHKNARCRLRRGKYKCVCRRKYKGNGVGSCKAVCKPKCRKNAVCIKGKCKCRRGYYRSKLLGICKRNALECLTETMGLDYVGSISTTVTGRTCQHWKKQSPHTHIYYNVGDGHNYCRNPDRESKPWCYTTDKDKRWEYCDIPLCIGPKPPCSTSLEMTCSSKSQKKTECTVADADKVNYVELVGSVNNAACVFGVTYGYYGKTIWSTKICQNKFKVCITPDIPDPEPPSSEGCRTTERGQEYKGSASVTENGLTCQYWKFQYPHKHSFEHLKTEHNYCRNPDNSARPWCYTNDPSKRWKYCHIPMCAVCTIQEDIDKCKASIQMSGKCLYKSKQGSKCNYSVELQGSEATVKIGTTEISLTNGRTLSECAQFTYDQGTLLIEEDVCKCKKDNM